MRKRWRLATMEDVLDVASRLRQKDIEEGEAMLGCDPRLFLTGFDPDNTYVLFNAAGDNVALAGVCPMKDNTAMIWMVATDLLEEHPIEFLKYSKAFIKEVSAPFSLLFNWVDARNEVHLKWLRWCGFTFIQRHEKFGAQGIPFYTFVMVV